MPQSKEERAAKQRAYNQTPKGKKGGRISNWKQQGIISNNWDSLYDRFLNCKKCENCDVELTIDRHSTWTRKCLDHDHSITDRENVRNVLCNNCNVNRGP